MPLRMNLVRRNLDQAKSKRCRRPGSNAMTWPVRPTEVSGMKSPCSESGYKESSALRIFSQALAHQAYSPLKPLRMSQRLDRQPKFSDSRSLIKAQHPLTPTVRDFPVTWVRASPKKTSGASAHLDLESIRCRPLRKPAAFARHSEGQMLPVSPPERSNL